MAQIQKILSMLGLGAGIAGTLTESAGNYRQAKAEQQAARWREQIATNNAELAELDALDSLERGGEAFQQHRLKMRAFKGAQRATLAANGIMLSEGSALRMLTDTDFFSDIDSNQIFANAEREATNNRARAVDFRNQATLARYQADSIDPTLVGASSLLIATNGS